MAVKVGVVQMEKVNDQIRYKRYILPSNYIVERFY